MLKKIRSKTFFVVTMAITAGFFTAGIISTVDANRVSPSVQTVSTAAPIATPTPDPKPTPTPLGTPVPAPSPSPTMER